jgi:hypothetical protein
VTSRHAARAGVACLGALLAGCLAAPDDSSSSEDALSAPLLLEQGDSPADNAFADPERLPPVRKGVVTIQKIYLHPAQGHAGVLLTRGPITTNLLTLSEDIPELVGHVPIPSHRYDALRIVITGAYLELSNGAIFATKGYDAVPPGEPIIGTLVTPSFARGGLQVKLPEHTALEERGVHRIDSLLFDVSECFGHWVGQSRRWVMHPVIKGQSLDAVRWLDPVGHPVPGPD